MPYDPRPVSQGGNRGIGERFSAAAPNGKFRVILVDTFDGGDCVLGDFENQHAAMKLATAHGGQMTRVYVYDDKGACVFHAGSF